MRDLILDVPVFFWAVEMIRILFVGERLLIGLIVGSAVVVMHIEKIPFGEVLSTTAFTLWLLRSHCLKHRAVYSQLNSFFR